MNLRDYRKVVGYGSKYGVSLPEARTFQGILFSSRGECLRYIDLLNNPDVKDLRRQQEFIISLPFVRDQIKYKKVSIKVDFTYHDTKTGRFVIEDFKGKMMKDFEIKWTLLVLGNRNNPNILFKITTKDDIRY